MADFSGKSPSQLSDAHLRAIGAIIVNWNMVELVMEMIALGFYRIPFQKGLVFTSNLSFQNKLAILRIAGGHGAIENEAQKRDFIGFLDRIEEAHKKRNAVAHGWWGAHPVQGLAKRMSLRARGRKLTAARENVPLSDLEAIANEFLLLHAEFGIWRKTFGVSPDLPTDDSSQPDPRDHD